MRIGQAITVAGMGGTLAVVFGPIDPGSLLESTTLFVGGGSNTLRHSAAIFDVSPQVEADWDNAVESLWNRVTISTATIHAAVELPLWQRIHLRRYFGLFLVNVAGMTSITGGVFIKLRHPRPIQISDDDISARSTNKESLVFRSL